ncbi:hypothetical protein KCP69_06460 [Salmonella enterica subsp. enterica]|nr:hypothetical protein KCP69_06460 [Salmonella enterica subsp. enterica]
MAASRQTALPREERRGSLGPHILARRLLNSATCGLASAEKDPPQAISIRTSASDAASGRVAARDEINPVWQTGDTPKVSSVAYAGID